MPLDLFIVNYLSPIFYRLLFMSITAIAIAFVIKIIQGVFYKNISPLWRYLLWTPMLVALLIPYRPQSDFSLVNDTTKFTDVSYREDELFARRGLMKYKMEYQQDFSQKPNVEYQANLQTKIEKLHTKSVIFEIIIPAIWFLGMITVITIIIISKTVLDSKIKKHTISTGDFSDILAKCKQMLHIKRNIEILTQDYLSSPAIIGVFKPKIILLSHAESISKESLSYILLHELAHYKKGDLSVNYFLLILQAIHWFNPLVWLCFRFVREDMEFANDSYVLSKIDDREHKNYARALVEILGYSNKIRLMPKLLCMVDGKKNVERRISAMKPDRCLKKHKILISVCCLLLIFVVGTLFLTQTGELKSQPAIYAHTRNNQVYKLELCGYSWSYRGVKEKSDAMEYFEIDYDENSTVVFNNKGRVYENFFLSTSNKRIDGQKPHFKIIEMNMYSDGVQSKFSAFEDDFIEIMINGEEKTNYYNFVIEFEQGTVNYGLRVDKKQESHNSKNEPSYFKDLELYVMTADDNDNAPFGCEFGMQTKIDFDLEHALKELTSLRGFNFAKERPEFVKIVSDSEIKVKDVTIYQKSSMQAMELNPLVEVGKKDKKIIVATPNSDDEAYIYIVDIEIDGKECVVYFEIDFSLQRKLTADEIDKINAALEPLLLAEKST